MATTTQNLGLIKPAGTDKIRIAQINSNMDTIDAKMGPVGSTPLQTQVTNNLNAFNAANILPIAEATIPANADLNDYYTPGVYRVASDAIGQTLQNTPYAASGKLIVITRTNNTGYTTQIWMPSSSALRMFVRNYNAGSFSDWKENALMETGTWVPHFYDNETKVLEAAAQNYYKIGGLCFATFDITLSSALTITNVLQFRNLPFSFCWSGSFWYNGWGVGSSDNVHTVQAVSGSAVFRPNISGTFASGRKLSGILIGV